VLKKESYFGIQQCRVVNLLRQHNTAYGPKMAGGVEKEYRGMTKTPRTDTVNETKQENKGE
jgi:hypothetical protein